MDNKDSWWEDCLAAIAAVLIGLAMINMYEVTLAGQDIVVISE